MEIPEEALYPTEESGPSIMEVFIPSEEDRSVELGIRIIEGNTVEVCTRVNGEMCYDLDERGWCHVDCAGIMEQHAAFVEVLRSSKFACTEGNRKNLIGWGQVR